MADSVAYATLFLKLRYSVGMNEIAGMINLEEFSEIFDVTYDRLFSYILKRCGDYALAQDIVSETYLKALKNLPKFEQRGKPIIAWLYRIACNELTSYFRKTSKYRCIELEQCPELRDYHSNQVEQYELQEREQDYITLRQAIAQLPELDQTIISLRFFEDKTIPEIAEITEQKVGTIKSRLSRALKKMQLTLQRLGYTNVI